MVQHWRVRSWSPGDSSELTDFEIRYFFSYTAKEHAAIFSRYGDYHRLAVPYRLV